MKTDFDSLTAQEKRDTIHGIIEDTISNFLYYDRKECEMMGIDDLENAIRDEVLTVEDVVQMFREHLEHNLA